VGIYLWAEEHLQLHEVITALETDQHGKVVICDSAVEGFLALRPTSQMRIKTLMERGFRKAGDVENRLGYHVGQIDR